METLCVVATQSHHSTTSSSLRVHPFTMLKVESSQSLKSMGSKKSKSMEKEGKSSNRSTEKEGKSKKSSSSKKKSNDLDKSSTHSRTGKSSSSKSKKSKNVRLTGMDALLEKQSSSSFITTPVDEISISSDISARSSATDVTMTSRGSRVSTISKLPGNLGRSGKGLTFGR